MAVLKVLFVFFFVVFYCFVCLIHEGSGGKLPITTYLLPYDIVGMSMVIVS